MRDGSYNAAGAGAGGWKGDALVVSSDHAKIRVFYDDEVPEPNAQPQGAGGFIKKLFGNAQSSTAAARGGPSGSWGVPQLSSPVRGSSFEVEGKQSLKA